MGRGTQTHDRSRPRRPKHESVDVSPLTRAEKIAVAISLTVIAAALIRILLLNPPEFKEAARYGSLAAIIALLLLVRQFWPRFYRSLSELFHIGEVVVFIVLLILSPFILVGTIVWAIGG